MWSVAGQMESMSVRVEVYVAQGSACLARSSPGFKLQYHKERGGKQPHKVPIPIHLAVC